MRSPIDLYRAALCILLLAAPCIVNERVSAEIAPLRDGDIIFQRSRSAQGAAIELATGSTYTHMGIVLYMRGRPFVLEAVGPVRLTPLHAFTERGIDGEYVVKRLRDAATRLTPEVRARIRSVAERYVGRPYDGRFEWSDERIYCSELVYKVYEQGAGIRIGALVQARTLALDAPEVQRLIARRFRNEAFDPNEPVISPGAMFSDPSLETVVAR